MSDSTHPFSEQLMQIKSLQDYGRAVTQATKNQSYSNCKPKTVGNLYLKALNRMDLRSRQQMSTMTVNHVNANNTSQMLNDNCNTRFKRSMNYGIVAGEGPGVNSA